MLVYLIASVRPSSPGQTFLDMIKMINARIWMMAVHTEHIVFIPLSVTLILFRCHSGFKVLKLKAEPLDKFCSHINSAPKFDSIVTYNKRNHEHIVLHIVKVYFVKRYVFPASAKMLMLAFYQRLFTQFVKNST